MATELLPLHELITADADIYKLLNYEPQGFPEVLLPTDYDSVVNYVYGIMKSKGVTLPSNIADSIQKYESMCEGLVKLCDAVMQNSSAIGKYAACSCLRSINLYCYINGLRLLINSNGTFQLVGDSVDIESGVVFKNPCDVKIAKQILQSRYLASNPDSTIPFNWLYVTVKDWDALLHCLDTDVKYTPNLLSSVKLLCAGCSTPVHVEALRYYCACNGYEVTRDPITVQPLYENGYPVRLVDTLRSMSSITEILDYLRNSADTEQWNKFMKNFT